MPTGSLAGRIHNAPARSLCISTITEAELRYGLLRMPPEARMQRLVPAFLADIQIQTWSSSCARSYSVLASEQRDSGASLSIFDTMIAAHALAHGFTLVTHDRAFTRIPGLAVEDWTEGPHPA